MSRRRNQQEPVGQLPPRQIIHPIANVQLGEPNEDGSRALLVHTLGPNTLQLFPMDAEQVKELGDAALAPHVTAATPAEVAGVVSGGGVVLGGGV